MWEDNSTTLYPGSDKAVQGQHYSVGKVPWISGSHSPRKGCGVHASGNGDIAMTTSYFMLVYSAGPPSTDSPNQYIL